MGFFTNRERNVLDKLRHVGGGAREFAHDRRDAQEARRPVERDPGVADRERQTPPEPKEADPGSLLQTAFHAQVREIDILIADLQRMRETLNSEAARVQQAVVEYATFSETALRSSKVICESLRSGLRPLQGKRHSEKRSSRARRKAARRLARQMKRGNTGTEPATREPQARPA